MPQRTNTTKRAMTTYHRCFSVHNPAGGLAHPLRHPAEAAPPFAVFEGWELGISGAKLLQKDRSIRVQGNEIIYLTLGPWTKPVQILVKPPAHLVFG